MRGEGSPLPVNYKEAKRLTLLASDKGNAMAISNLAILLAKGKGEPCDFDEACRLWRRAIALGDEPSKDYLRSLAQEGHAPSLATVRELGLGPL